MKRHKKPQTTRSAHTAVLHAVSGSSFEEVLPVIPFPRLCFVFLWRGHLIMSAILLCLRRPLHRKTSQKSLEKGFGGRTFPQKGFPPIVTYKLLYQHHCNIRAPAFRECCSCSYLPFSVHRGPLYCAVPCPCRTP